MKKIFTGFVLALSLAVLILPTTVFAQGTTTIAVSDASAQPGETAEMVIMVETDSGVSGAGIAVSYNTSALTLTDIRSLAAGSFVKDLDYDCFSWLNGKNLTGTFRLVALCFAVDPSASGDYTVKVEPIGGLAGNITNENALPVAASFVPGILSVVKESAGAVETPTTEVPDAPGPSDDVPPTSPPEDDPGQDPVTPEVDEPQTSPTVPETPTEEPKKETGDIGLYVAVIVAAAVGFLAGTIRKKRK